MRGKRAFDIALALALLLPGLPLMAAVWLLVRWRDGAPAFHASERMKAPGVAFRLYKFRTMRPGPASGVAGGDKVARITPLGRRLRRLRLDELPQLVNVLRGDMSLVGPRPPERQYVERFPALYAGVLRERPGLTGLATILFHSHEEMLLRDTATAAETDAIYVARCIPRKAALDRLYSSRKSLFLDLYVIYLTAARLLPLPGARAARLRAKAARTAPCAAPAADGRSGAVGGRRQCG